MEENKIAIFWIGLGSCLFIIMFLGMFWVMSISNSHMTIEVKMDENTQKYLGEHHYCMRTISEPYDSDKPSITFAGECEYLNMSIISIRD